MNTLTAMPLDDREAEVHFINMATLKPTHKTELALRV
jgi:hypothetical protein